MRVIVLHPAISPDAALEDQDSLVQVEAISAALGRLGHEATAMPCTLDLAALQRDLARRRPDAVFNLVESLAGADSLQYLPPALLDALAIPYTGAPTEAIFQTTHKLLAKQLLRLAGLPTPGELRVESGELRVESRKPGTDTTLNSQLSTLNSSQLSTLNSQLPWIIKAVWEHASRGLDEGNIVAPEEVADLPRRLREHQAASGRPCFAEQFIAGREFNLSLLGGPGSAGTGSGGDGPDGGAADVAVLPCAEIDFSAFPPGKPRIVGHRAKWEADSFEYHHTPRRFDFAAADVPLLRRMRELAAACWRLFGLRGYARVDFRVDQQGQPWILEVNANPCLSPDAGFAAAAERAGLTFDQAVARILAQAFSP